MRITNLLILLFLMSAFAIGVGLQEQEMSVIDGALNNATMTIDNISLQGSNENFYVDRILVITERGLHLFGVIMVEGMRMGIMFGHDNPEYFSTEFIIGIIKLIVIAFIVGALIQPAFYVLVFLVMSIIWIYDKLRKKKQK